MTHSPSTSADAWVDLHAYSTGPTTAASRSLDVTVVCLAPTSPSTTPSGDFLFAMPQLIPGLPPPHFGDRIHLPTTPWQYIPSPPLPAAVDHCGTDLRVVVSCTTATRLLRLLPAGAWANGRAPQCSSPRPHARELFTPTFGGRYNPALLYGLTIAFPHTCLF